MSAPARDVDVPIEGCRPTDVTPVQLDAASLDSTAPSSLRTLKRELRAAGLDPAELSVTACFEEDCSLSTQAEADRIRDLLRAASFLGVGAVTVTCETVAAPSKARPALEACVERAEREGLTIEFEGPISLDAERSS